MYVDHVTLLSLFTLTDTSHFLRVGAEGGDCNQITPEHTSNEYSSHTS